jgi:hypothetical protein
MTDAAILRDTWRTSDRKVLYVDLDNTLVDFQSGIDRLPRHLRKRFENSYDDAPGIFSLMEPIDGAVEAFGKLSEWFDAYILSTAPWNNPSAWQHKLEWVQQHIGRNDGTPAYKRLILSHHKNLLRGEFLVDDRTARGADRFKGELVQFGTDEFATWPEVTEYLRSRARRP